MPEPPDPLPAEPCAAALQPALPSGGERCVSPSFPIIIVIVIIVVAVIVITTTSIIFISKADLKFRQGAAKETPLKSSSGFVLR